MSQFWCADALLLSVTNGTVRLHARSHARGLKPSTCYEIGQCTAYGGYPGKHHIYTLHMLACSVYDPRHFSNPHTRVRSSFGVGSGTARRYLQSLPLHKPIRAQHFLLQSSQMPCFGPAFLPNPVYYTPR
ncbi:hypothetical protein B0T12DRAFT_261497 [Alternaria alternata]|nr:hypothetical protein B0T12DRAFT_261497 [Alternaria alternata]